MTERQRQLRAARDAERAAARMRRDRNRAAGYCINENKNGTHGAATHGVRCADCAATHRRGLTVVASDDFDPVADALVNAALDRETKN